MKKWTMRALALILCLVMTVGLGLSALAASEPEVTHRVHSVVVEGGYTLTMKDAGGNEIAATTASDLTGNVYINVEKMTLTLTSTAGKQYMVFLLNASEGADKTYPTGTNIRYINQEVGAEGMSFTIYPDDITTPGTYFVYVSSSEYTKVAQFTVAAPEYMLGDVDESKTIGLPDAVLILKHIAELTTLEGTQFKAADVDKSGAVGLPDAILVLKVIAGLLETLG